MVKVQRAVVGMLWPIAVAAGGCSTPADPPKAESKTDAKAKANADAKAEPKTDTRADAKTDAKAKPKAGTKPTTAAASSRTLTFTNECPFDLWLQSVGSNASMIPCSPSETNAQADCPTTHVCYAKDANTNYCVPGRTSSTTFPVSDPSDITLDPSQCASGTLVTTTTSDQWGQCTCTADSECPANQVCQTVVPGLQQCFWGYSLSDEGKLPASGGTTVLAIDTSSSDPNAIVASGKFFAKASCDVNGRCLSDNTKGAPATLVEYTFKGNNDWYDVSYINGINAPMAMVPTPSTSLDYQAGDPYRCMVAGGDAASIDAVLAFQRSNGISGNDELSAFACGNDYDATFTGELVGFNFVSEPSPATACRSSSDCSAAAPVCGLSLSSVSSNLTATTCGQRLGYWTQAQLCAASSTFADTSLGVDCSVPLDRAYAECSGVAGVTDQGPGRSCFNANTTVAGDTCCGYSAWSFGGEPMPLAPGSSAVDGVDTTTWTRQVLPAVQRIKEGCPLAYSFQFDDPYSTFTCASTDGINDADYEITLCPSKDAAGIDPPPPPTCTPSVPAGQPAASFTVGPPEGITVAVNACDAQGRCTTAVDPAGTNIYVAITSATDYQLTATNGSGVQQACTFSIPQDACIGRVTASASCSTWELGTDGPWAGRSIAIPSF